MSMIFSGYTDPYFIQSVLEKFVKGEVFKDHPVLPNSMDKAYYPSRKVIANHIYKVAKRQKFSQIDQVNLEVCISNWKLEHNSKFYFRPCTSSDQSEPKDILYDDSEDLSPHSISSGQEHLKHKLLYVHQELWQIDLLIKYGSQLCLLDATYKTTKYALPLFFLCVKTNVGYLVAGNSLKCFHRTLPNSPIIKLFLWA